MTDKIRWFCGCGPEKATHLARVIKAWAAFLGVTAFGVVLGVAMMYGYSAQYNFEVKQIAQAEADRQMSINSSLLDIVRERLPAIAQTAENAAEVAREAAEKANSAAALAGVAARAAGAAGTTATKASGTAHEAAKSVKEAAKDVKEALAPPPPQPPKDAPEWLGGR